ncbi:DUF3015 family protein [Leptospira wolffii]|uniref:DUF3015 family protein n=1 Tax=Leptospira wolffii TaxID=409998 RepID=A0A2M9ZCL4_9LEPT|nr:DUF3015 family protein [Leptospira wolffii]PJZ66163.1 hypothetical protein CH371_07685 [Leptospira wolffii]TGK58811.1 DUF3015 domain-containing protein [Leptospira wolffii]TGK72626.1 DUF3015 domain-containing protein [Leptospira wolffii]TGK72719.1 DUF3015 domain-containing protein [Leptospira wolffii]TGL26910.1 DUF3015 domain-containing protein [Leptospira wolffii]
MKKIFALSLFVTLFSIPTYVSAKYGAAGCGLGSIVISENKKVHQVVAATVNATVYNQLFGITTGTLGCETSGFAQKEVEQQIFVHLNYQSLEQEFAKGSGEKMEAFASLMGCSDAATFGKVGKEKFASLFDQNGPDAFLEKMRSEVASNSALASSCKI